MSTSNKNWEYIITTSGGSGHLSACNAIVLSKKKENISTKVLNIMRSSASYGKFIGKRFTDIWDNAQKKGNLKRQQLLITHQHFVDKILYVPTFITISKDLLSKETLPQKIHLTQAICLRAIFHAITFANYIRKKKGQKIFRIDLYMTDFPSAHALHFFEPLRRIKNKTNWTKMIRFHSPSPLCSEEMKANYWFQMTGIKNLHVIEEDIPIHPTFKNQNIPLPGHRCKQNISAFTHEEKVYHKHLIKKNEQLFSLDEKRNQLQITIDSTDRVGLLMLGSQPISKSLIDYLEKAATICKKHPPFSSSHLFFFLACGKSDKSENILLNESIQRIFNHSLHIRPNIHFIPFSGQPIHHIFSRADLSITKSGGLTTQELFTIKRKEILHLKKRVIIHTEKLSSNEEKNVPKDQLQEMLYRNKCKNLLWEGGNAEYLLDAFSPCVRIATVDTIDQEIHTHMLEKYPLLEA